MCDDQIKSCLNQWESVLIEWANCLSISKEICSISDLKSSDFLINILQLLTTSVIIPEQLLPKLCDFISLHYPNFKIAAPKLTTVHFLTAEQLVEISSLLMHYSCVYDRRDTLTSPLCTKLSGDVQLKIRSFLESFSLNTEKVHLRNVIAMAMGADIVNVLPSTPKALFQWQSAGGDSRRTSPLQEYLKTPSGKGGGRIQEKDKEIKNLRYELQVERYEKEDMTVEIKEYKEKIKKLGQQINEKSKTITKLHGELVALENRTPPHKPKEMKEIERALRADLLDSQTYISQLQEELDQLQQCKKETMKKLRTSEESLCILQMKAEELEAKNDTLNDENRQQKLELNSLRNNCNELSALLNEMRSSKEDDGSDTEPSVFGRSIQGNSFASYEDLAKSVVDVQLQEAQRENSELTINLHKLEADFKHLAESLERVREENKEMELEISTLKLTQNNLVKSNDDLTDNIKLLSEEKLLQKSELDVLNMSLLETKTILAKRDDLFTSLQMDFKALQTNHAELQNDLQQRESSHEKLQIELEAVQSELEAAVKKYDEERFEKQALEKLYSDLDGDLGGNLRKLEILITGDSGLSFSDKFDAFNILLTRLEAKNEVNDKQRLDLDHCKTVIEKLELETAILRNEKETDAKTIETIKQDLDAAKRINLSLQGDIEKNVQKTTEVMLLVEDLNKTIDDLKKLVDQKSAEVEELNNQRVVSENEIKSRDEEILRRITEDEKMRRMMMELDDVKTSLERKLDAQYKECQRISDVNKTTKAELDTVVKTSGAEIEKYKSDLHNLREEYITQNRKQIETIALLTTTITAHEKRLETLEIDLKVSQENSNKKQTQLDELQTLKNQIEAEHLKQGYEAEKKIELLKLTIDKLNNDVERFSKEKELLEEELDAQKGYYDMLREEKEGYISDCENMRKEIVELAGKLSKKEEECMHKDDVNSKAAQELLALKLELEGKHNEIKGFKEQAEILHAEKQETKNIMQDLETTNKTLAQKIDASNTEINVLTQLKSDLEQKYTTLDEQTRSLEHQLGVSRVNLVSSIADLSDFQISATKEIEVLKLSLEEAGIQLERANDDEYKLKTDHEDQVRELNKEMNAMMAELEDCKRREILALQEMDGLRDEMSMVVNKYTDSLQAEKDLKMETDLQINSLTENIHGVVQKLNDLDDRHKELTDEYTECKKTLEDLTTQKQQLEIEIVKQKESYESEFISSAEEYKVELENLTQHQRKLEAEIERLSTEVTTERGSRARIETELDQVKADFQSALQERADLLVKVETLISTNQAFTEDYGGLKIEHENYMKENTLTLSKMELSLDNTLKDMKEQKEKYDEEIGILRNTVEDLEREKEEREAEFVEEVGKKDDEIKEIYSKIQTSEGNMETLLTEQNKLKEKIMEDNKLYERISAENTEKIKELELTITKLSCANDILETGKTHLEKSLEELHEKVDALEEEKSLLITEHNETTTKLETTIQELNDQLKEMNSNITTMKAEILDYEQQIVTINKITDCLKVDLNSATEGKSEIQFRLEMIEEDNNRKVQEHVDKFAELVEKYDQLKEEIVYVEEERDLLKKELDDLENEKDRDDLKLSEKEAELDAVTAKYNSLSESLLCKDRLIDSLQEEVADKVGKLERIYEHKLELQGEVEKIRCELTEAVRNRDELREEREAMLGEIGAVLMEQHGEISEVRDVLQEMKKDGVVKVLRERLSNESKIITQLRCFIEKEKETSSEVSNLLNSERKTKLDLENTIQRERGKYEEVKKLLEEEKSFKQELQKAIEEEKKSRDFFELQLLNLKNEKDILVLTNGKLKSAIEKLSFLINEAPVELNEDEDAIDTMIKETEARLIAVFAKSREINEIVKSLEADKEQMVLKLQELESSNNMIAQEKEKLLSDYNQLHEEKSQMNQQKDKDMKYIENLRTQHEALKEKFDDLKNKAESDEKVKCDVLSNNETLQAKYEELMQRIESQSSNSNISERYDEFLKSAQEVKLDINKMIAERNSLETLLYTLKEVHVNLQIRTTFITETQHKLLYEQKQALDVIIDDIQKQFNRYSKMAFNINMNTTQIFEKTVSSLIIGKKTEWRESFDNLDIGEVLVKFDYLKDNANNTLDQMKSFEKSVDSLKAKALPEPRVLKENKQTAHVKDEDWKKKYLTAKQKLTLAENAKNVFEKKLKILREENTKLKSSNVVADPDVHYKSLLQQHIRMKDEHEKVIDEYDAKYKKLLNEFEQYKTSKGSVQLETINHTKLEIEKIREAYNSVLSVNSRLNVEKMTLQKLLDEKNSQLNNLQSIKEAYEKLFEENNKLLAEIDTLKYKRNRDREEYVRLLKKEKEEREGNRRIQEVRTEYELKLEKMKDKMVKLYKEEVDKQMVNVAAEKDQNYHLLRTIKQLQEDLHQANLKIGNLQTERFSMVQHQQSHFNDTAMELFNRRDSVDSRMMMRRGSTQSLCVGNQERMMEERRFSTLPRSITGMDVIEEVHVKRRLSITSTPSTNLEMEDEAEMFNNKYLTDLKEGRCNLPNEEDSSSRLSELAYRNSLCPPHLKSSYPLETQFVNPRKFKDDDLKAGNVDLDDSMTTRLLPNDKHKKKDIGQTAYKKPGPPTPSKNAGRLSLQGSEPHPRDVLRENGNQKSPKRTTPNRLKALFSRTKDSSENLPVSPKGRRLSIFRKPR